MQMEESWRADSGLTIPHQKQMKMHAIDFNHPCTTIVYSLFPNDHQHNKTFGVFVLNYVIRCVWTKL